MELEYVLSLADRRASLATAGGKGASLAKLAGAGLPVPDGFHVTTDAYQRFLAENELQPAIMTVLGAIDTSRPATLEVASQTIQALFAEASMPGDVAAAIAHAYANLPGNQPPVAVRSSATAEDLPGLSFAGQQETFLNVAGVGEVLDAVQRCWASLWTARAIGYRQKHRIDQGAVSLAVVVQMLVPAEAAGILFTANPLTGQRDEAMINASWGLGEAIVGGKVSPDTIVVDKTTGCVVTRDTGNKQVMTVRINGGTSEQPVPESMQRAPVLDDKQAARLAQLGVQIEALYEYPMDIEWTLTDGQFAVVQARPITALPEPQAILPTEWVLPDPKGKYMRTSIVDYMADPLTPLFRDIGVPAIQTNIQRVVSELTGTPDAVPAEFMVTINDYPYIVGSFTAREWWLMLTRLLPKFPMMLRTSEHRWRERALPKYISTIARWGERPLEELSAADCLTGARAIMDAAAYLVTTLQTGPLGAAAGSEGLFTAVYGKFIRRESDPPAPTFLLGFDSTPILSEKALFDLAVWCREQDGLAAHLLETPSSQLVSGWQSDETPSGIEAGTWQEWQGRFRTHLDQYGHMIYDLDFAKPVPVDDPTPLLEALKMYLRSQGINPYERQRRLTDRREAAIHAVESRTRGLKRKVFGKMLGLAQRLGPQREDGIADIGLGYSLLRQLLQELGRRLVEAGGIEEPDDIFWLRADEASQMAGILDRGEAPYPMADAVQQRKIRWRAKKSMVPPPMLPPSKKYLGLSADVWASAHAGDQIGATLKGVGCSPGVVTATARVLHGPEDFDQMEPGDILVATITTPAWTPLFSMASGVVTDIGGTLSHGSIVAREYGIPAVLGTGVATKRIQSGQTITVDGSAGLVVLSEDGEGTGG